MPKIWPSIPENQTLTPNAAPVTHKKFIPYGSGLRDRDMKEPAATHLRIEVVGPSTLLDFVL
jgi:hypothetical protein